jgi:cell division protein FtsQ
VDRVPGERRRKLARAVSLALPSLLALTTLAGAGSLAWRYAWRGDLLRVGEIQFTGLSRARAEELLALAPVRRGDHLLGVDPDVIEAALVRHPWISAVEVRRRLPPAIDVRVVERRAAALVELGDLYLVDDRGVVFKRATPGDGLDLPVVTGIEAEDWLERRDDIEGLLTAALALVDRWSARKLDARAPIAEIHVDPEFGTTVWAADGTEIRLGQKGIDEKLSRLERLLPALDAEGRHAEVIHLDNRRHPEWVAVRFEAG